MPVCDNWMVIDNLDVSPEIIATGRKNEKTTVKNAEIWNIILNQGIV
jgi:hypothetical protein